MPRRRCPIDSLEVRKIGIARVREERKCEVSDLGRTPIIWVHEDVTLTSGSVWRGCLDRRSATHGLKVGMHNATLMKVSEASGNV